MKKYNRLNLIYNSIYNFYEYYDINFNSLSLTSKLVSTSFYNELNKFYSLKPQKKSIIERKATVYDKVSEMYNEYLETYFDQ